MSEPAEARMHELALKQSAGTLTNAERGEYETLVEQAQALMVENARALTRRHGPEAIESAQAAERRALRAARRSTGNTSSDNSGY
jgi:hypothetical protein